MKLTEKQKEEIVSKEHDYINLDGIEYFCKIAKFDCNEILAYRLASIVGINCPLYHIVNINEELYYLSYSFNNLGKFKCGKDLIGLDYFTNTMYNLWHVVENEYPKECKDLMFDLVKVFIFDIFMLNGDRHAGNYAIVEENGKPKIYIFDNESIFESVFRVELSPKYDKRDFLRNGTRIIKNPKTTIGMKQNMELLEYFLTTSSNYFCKLVVDFYNKLTPEAVYSNVLEIEKATGITNHDKDYNMELFRRNYELIGDLLKDKGLIKKEGR